MQRDADSKQSGVDGTWSVDQTIEEDALSAANDASNKF